MKIRIFALAKELGLDSKELISHANDAGISLKNSALASVTEEQRDTIVNHFKQLSAKPSAVAVEEPATPVRDENRDAGGKVRKIRTQMMTPRPQHSGKPVEVEVEVEQESDEKDVASDQEGTPETEDLASEKELVASSDEVQDVVEKPTSDKEDPKAKTETKAKSNTTRALSKDDYVPPGGAGAGSIREMKPRASISNDSDSGQSKRSKQKERPAVPNIAAIPNFTPVKKKPKAKEETKAQKPDIPLTAELLEQQQSPLKAHMQDKKRRKETGKDLIGDKLKDKKSRMTDGRPEDPKKSRRRGGRGLDQDRPRFRSRSQSFRRRRKQPSGPIVHKTEAEVELPISVRSLSEAMGRPAKEILKILFEQGVMSTINQSLEEEQAMEIALEFGVDLSIKRQRDIEEELIASIDVVENEENLQHRPPIVTILGHVDHGKTSLLDKIRSAKVADGEAGGITQHISAYQVEQNGQKVTFVDTPGHAAFGEMRARGATVTDIIVLVVAADDGVMPQTVECISHAKSAGVPIIVAMNKCDLPDTNEQKVLQDLAAHEILPSEWGGDVEVIRTSAMSGQGIDELLETILLTAELEEYKADPDTQGMGVCIEAFRDEGRGVIAWLVNQKGTLKIGDVMLCGDAVGRVRAIYDDHGNEIQEAPPSMPVKVTGLNIVPGAGDQFFVMDSVEEAREVAETRSNRERSHTLSKSGAPRTLEDILDAARQGEIQDLPLILKADTPGSLEALRGEIDKLDHPEVRTKVVHDGVGGVNESDIYLASVSGAIIIAFHVIAEDKAQLLAENEGVDIRRFNIIYEITDTIKQSLEGLLRPEKVEVATGRALVLRTFHISRFGTIAGCRVLSGTIDRSSRVHVIRDQAILNDYSLASLKREKDDAKEVREGMECGIRLDGFNDVKEGDLFEAFRIDEVKRTLDD